MTSNNINYPNLKKYQQKLEKFDILSQNQNQKKNPKKKQSNNDMFNTINGFPKSPKMMKNIEMDNINFVD